ncbi:sensor histidine kinase [Lacrimispora sp. 210928-DFI.3.58]|uniref:sensor histidine kinase n=1 Tax=Lacrimispora sp. 210928-DFI.3.58 TaxID=2883214 RepID=UPI001D0748A0|nr:HAMP domain-containing sensor histidine kinase [Lacrimispora sp. 210928-DFI.3.58]MCB7319177.1 HAMP domain-containing histidine kinase [Lacrimispora sp. 210928-DFI.3.58]
MKEIDRLRWKFMFYNMLIVTAVIGVTFCCAALLVKKRGRQEINAVLSQAVEYQDLHGRQWQDPEQTRVPHFSVLVQPDGVIVLQDGAYHSFPDQEFLESVVFLGMDGGQETGNLEDYSLRYLRVSGSAGDLIAFADTSYEESMMDEVLLHGGLACCLIWLGFLVLSYFFARWAVRPVEESVRRQKQFVADASHELKTPLTVITANAELLKERCEGMAEDVDKWLDNVDQECIQMRRLVESLLLLARSDLMKKGRKDWERIDLSDLLLEELLTFEPVFYQMGKTIAYETGDPVWVKGNPAQLKQVIQILLDNAVKYSKEGGRTEIRLEPWGRRKLCLWVKSEGNVIPKEQRKAIFQRFYRGEASHSSEEGYGLGLAIAKEIAENHKGDMGVVCEEGRNCFYLKLRQERSGPCRKKTTPLSIHKN